MEKPGVACVLLGGHPQLEPLHASLPFVTDADAAIAHLVEIAEALQGAVAGRLRVEAARLE